MFVLLMGLPAAGKTTLAKILESRIEGAKRFSYDEMGEGEERAHSHRKECERAAIEWAEREGRGVAIVDDNLHLPSMRRPFVRAGRRLGCRVLVVLLEVTEEEAVERNASRQWAVEEKSVRRMWQDMEPEEQTLILRVEKEKQVEQLIERIEQERSRWTVEKEEEKEEEKEQGEAVWSRLDRETRAVVRRLVEEGEDGRIVSERRRRLLRDWRSSGRREWTEQELREQVGGTRSKMRRRKRKGGVLIGFSWVRRGDVFYGVARGRLWMLTREKAESGGAESGEGVWGRVLARREGEKKEQEEEDQKVLEDYFQVSVSTVSLCAEWSKKDEHVRRVLQQDPSLCGVRSLRQDPLETLLAFICSANNNITRIYKMVNRLATLYGSRMVAVDNGGREGEGGEGGGALSDVPDELMFDFPTVDQLKEAREDMESRLRSEGFGYRAAYIRQTVDRLVENGVEGLEKLRESDYPTAREELRKYAGVGPKVADCICLMSLDKPGVVPVDTHVLQVTQQRYLPSLSLKKGVSEAMHGQIGDFYRARFGEYAGWTQTVLFNSQLQKKKQKRRRSSGEKEKGMEKEKSMEEEKEESVVKEKEKRGARRNGESKPARGKNTVVPAKKTRR